LAFSAARSSSWFSMMPLCTSAMRPGARALRVGAGAVAEVRVRVVHRRRAVRGPARVGDAGAAFDLVVATCAISSATREVLRARFRPPACTATPQES
jgi:hypothetical protein